MTQQPAASDETGVVAVYASHDQAEAAVRALQDAGVDLVNVSVVGQGHEGDDQIAGYFTHGGERRHVGRRGGFWNAIWDLLSDTGTFYIPGSGPIMVAGPVVGRLVGAVEGAVEEVEELAHVGGEEKPQGHPGALASALVSAGLPSAQANAYEAAINSGHFLVVVHGSAADAVQTQAVLQSSGASQVSTYEA